MLKYVNSSGLVFLAGVILFACSSAHAAVTQVTVSNATIAAGDNAYGGAAITTVDGTGMGSGFPTFPDTHNGFNVHGYLGSGTTASLHYDLGSPLNLSKVRVWNYHGVWNGPGSGIPSRGARDIVLYGSNDGAAYGNDSHASWTQFTTFTLARVGDVGDPGVTPYGEEFDFSDVTCRYVKFRIQNNYGSGIVGLAEIQFVGIHSLAASNPSPVSEAAGVDPAGLTLSWDCPLEPGTYTYDVYDMDSLTDPSPVLVSGNQSGMSYIPSPELDYGTTYFWRVDTRLGGVVVATGDVWTFTTGSAATNPSPEDGGYRFGPTVLLNWDATLADNFDVYLGTDPQALGSPVNTAETELLVAVDPNTTYYWAVDTKDAQGAVMVTGDVWSFTVIDVRICNTPLAMDVNNDCVVNLDDFAQLAAEWLTDNNLDDFAQLAAEWLDSTLVNEDPTSAMIVTESEQSYLIWLGSEVDNRSITLSNIGEDLVVDPWVTIAGAKDWFSTPRILDEILQPPMTDRDKALAIWAFLKDNRYHDEPAHTGAFETHDPVRFLNVYGYGFCDDSATNLLVLCEAAGIPARVWGLSGHVVPEAYFDSGWHVLDADGEIYYLDDDDWTISSIATLEVRPDIIRKYPSPFYTDTEFVVELYTTTHDNAISEWYRTTSEATHQMGLTLRPGESLMRSWDNWGKYFYTTYTAPPARFGNGRWTFEPIFENDLYLKGVGSVQGIEAVPVGDTMVLQPSDGTTPGTLIYRFQSPYPFLDGMVDLTGHVDSGGQIALAFSEDGGSWQTIWSSGAEGDVEASIPTGSYFRNGTGRPMYAYSIRLTLQSSQVEWIRYIGDFQLAPHALPALMQGKNVVEYTDQSASRSVSIQFECVPTP